MGVVSWDGGRVSIRASVQVPRAITGAKLRDSYIEAIKTQTLGLARFRDGSIMLGPLTLLRFGPPKVTRNAVDWPIEGGLLARRAGGNWRLQAATGRVEATVAGYTPRLPRPIYAATHMQVHQLFSRLYLLRLRGPDSLPGTPATPGDRFRAGTVDVAFCLTLAGFSGRRRLRRTLFVIAVYHIVCWSISGRTLGGLVMRHQALLRLALTPVSWLSRRPVHDEIAATEVIADP